MTKKKKPEIHATEKTKKVLDQLEWMEKMFDFETLQHVDKIEFDFAAAEAHAASVKDFKGKMIFHMRDYNTKH